jgi:hypothetical protein
LANAYSDEATGAYVEPENADEDFGKLHETFGDQHSDLFAKAEQTMTSLSQSKSS